MSLVLPSRASTTTRRARITSAPSLVIALLAALLQTACPGGAELDDADAFVGSGGTGAGGGGGGGGPCDIQKLLNSKCGASICHGTADMTSPPLGNINLSAPGVEARVYDAPASYMNITTGSTNCPTPAEKLLDPAGLSTSLMYTKINGGHACGAPMPSVGKMEPSELTCYNDWLQSILDAPPTP